MFYSNFYVRNRIKIPTAISLLIVGLITFLLSKSLFITSTPSNASKHNLKKILLTNVSSQQIGILWQTSQKEYGLVFYGEQKDKLDKTALDERDVKTSKSMKTTHYVVIKDLKENTEYFFKPSNEKAIYAKTKNEPFSFRTIKKITTVSNLRPAYGKILDKNNEPLTDVLVVLSLKETYPLIAISKPSGEWLLPISYLIDKQTKLIKTPKKDQTVVLEFYGQGLYQETKVTAAISQLSPLSESIIMGKTYNFTQKENVLSASSVNDRKIQAIDITYPKQGGQVPSNIPLIKGTAIKQTKVKVRLTGFGVDLTESVDTDKTGVWKLNLKKPLQPGKYSVVMNAQDSLNKTISRKREFLILKSGDQVLGEATPSATEAPTLPTAAETPTSFPTTPTPTLPVSGNNMSVFTLSSISLILLGLGLLVAF